MSRYIDAAELFDKVYEDVSAYYEEGKEVKDEILQIIADFRTADVQEVVRCKDCLFRYSLACFAAHKTADMDFCSDGAKMDLEDKS